MEKDKIAVIGNKDSVLVFKAVGCDVLGVEDSSKVRNILNKALKEYKLIFITDNYASLVEDIILDTQLSAYPVVTVIPSGTGKSDYALKQISLGVEKALGVNILFDKEN